MNILNNYPCCSEYFPTQLLTPDHSEGLISMLPERFQLCSPQLLFRLTEHGSSFTEFWKRIDNAERTILIIKTSTGHIFGVYCSGSWTNRRNPTKRYFGTGETFLFKVDEKIDVLHFYPWIGSSPNDMFLAAGQNYLLIGGNGLAITINDELHYGCTFSSEMFNNPPLVCDHDFIISELEVFSVL